MNMRYAFLQFCRVYMKSIVIRGEKYQISMQKYVFIDYLQNKFYHFDIGPLWGFAQVLTTIWC